MLVVSSKSPTLMMPKDRFNASTATIARNHGKNRRNTYILIVKR